MKALVHPGPAKEATEERSEPEITASTDVLVKTTKTTIHGSDPRISKGDAPTCQSGRILRHEGTGLADPPVRRVARDRHRMVATTLPFGSVLHDYLA